MSISSKLLPTQEYADDDVDKILLRNLRKFVLKKLKMQHIIVRDWGFELPTDSILDSATVKYTDFLQATASGKSVGVNFPSKIATPFEKTKLAAYALTALAPCMRISAFFSTEIKALLDPDESSHIYKKWIDSLSSHNFEASASQIEDLLDKLTISLTGEELKVVENVYHQAIKLEVDFFSSQPIVQNTVVPLYRAHHAVDRNLTVLCDFDITCSTIDSSALLAEIAIVKASNCPLDGCGTELSWVSSDDVRTSWNVLSSQYIKEYDQCIQSIMLSETVISIVDEFNYGSMYKALEKLLDFEKRVNSRVVKYAVLKGLNLKDTKLAGEHLVLQDGCRDFFKEFLKTDDLGSKVHLLSYCWCGDLIRSALSSGNLNGLNVHSNELIYGGHITACEFLRKVESPMENLQAFSNIILNKHRNDGKQITVKIGGSVGDLICLLKADIGIVISLSARLKRLADHFSISFIPLFSGLVNKQREVISSLNWKGLSGTLYTVSSWAEIHAFILGS